MQYKPLPRDIIKRMLFGTHDELTDLSRTRMSQIKSKPCPRCKSALHPYFHPTSAFTPDDPLPRTIGRCVDCGLEWDPTTDMILKTGDPTRMEDPVPIVRRGSGPR